VAVVTFGLSFIAIGLFIEEVPIEKLPIEKFGPFPRELWRLIFLGAGLSWILTLPTLIILWRVKPKLSDRTFNNFSSIAVIAIIIVVGGIIGCGTGKGFVCEMLGLLLPIGLSYLLYIPLSLALYMMFLPLYYKSKLSTIGYEINVLRERISEYETILDQRSKIEKDIESIVAFDPSNLNVKARELQEKAQGMTYDEIEARSIEINLELSRIDSLKEEAERKLRALEDRKRDLELRISDINSRLYILERMDPANFQIKMQKLKQLGRIGREELKKVKPVGEIEELFFERISLSYQINDISEEIKDTVEEISRMELKRKCLQLEGLTLDLEKVNRTVRSIEPRLLEMRDNLRRLENKRDRARTRLSSLQQK
jgi:2C-methyl-D-erythritol 2,4-cyclodiphosphate synthase